MKENTITFTPAAQLRKGLHFILRGIVLTVSAIGSMLNRIVRRYPYFVIAAVLLLAFILSYVFIARARAERDSLNRKNYILQQRIDSILIINPNNSPKSYVYHSN